MTKTAELAALIGTDATVSGRTSGDDYTFAPRTVEGRVVAVNVVRNGVRNGVTLATDEGEFTIPVRSVVAPSEIAAAEARRAEAAARREARRAARNA